MSGQLITSGENLGGRPRSRPSVRDKKAIALLCERLASGMSMTKACIPHDVPGKVEVYAHMQKDERFRTVIARAREIQQHVCVDETVDLADAATAEDWAAVRLKIHARQWRAGKLMPKVYGDKLLHTGADGEGPIEHKLDLDMSQLEDHELVEFKRLLDKAQRKKIAAPQAPMIEGEIVEDDDQC